MVIDPWYATDRNVGSHVSQGDPTYTALILPAELLHLSFNLDHPWGIFILRGSGAAKAFFPCSKNSNPPPKSDSTRSESLIEWGRRNKSGGQWIEIDEPFLNPWHVYSIMLGIHRRRQVVTSFSRINSVALRWISVLVRLHPYQTSPFVPLRSRKKHHHVVRPDSLCPSC